MCIYIGVFELLPASSQIQLQPSFLQSFLSCVRSRRARIIRSFLQPFPHHRWQVPPWGVNAYYSVSDHAVVFPAGLLQPPFFHPGYPRAVNFGAAGSIMAHEMLHILYQLCEYSGPLGGEAAGSPEDPKGGLEEEKGRLCEGSRWDSPEAFAILLGAFPVCSTPMSSPLASCLTV